MRRRRFIVTVAAAACIAGGVSLGVMGVHIPGAPRPATLILAAHRDVAPSVPAPTLTASPVPAAMAAGADTPALAAVAAGAGTPAPVALSRLNLYGTVARGDPTAGYALLGATQQTASLYGSGVEVAPGVFLQEIYTNRVVLARNGALLEVRIGSSPSSASPGGLGAVQSDDSSPPVATSADMLRAGASGNESMPGIRVYPGRNRGAFARLGLHPGDLVTAINGAPVSGPDSIDLQQMLKDLGHASVTVFRAGRLQQLAVQHADSADASDADTD
jgi:general secretion pathway protein C